MPQYERAVAMAGGEAVRIPLDADGAEIAQILRECDGVLLPGSSADVDPVHYGATKHPKTASSDEPRHAVDQVLLETAYSARLPVLGICYGMQSLSVFRKGTLLQHIESAINHEAGRKVPIAHRVEVESGSRLANIVSRKSATAAQMRDQPEADAAIVFDVNSSHHQSVEGPG